MKLFPKWRDYKKYTIPNKLAVLGFYLAALSLVVYLITLIPFQRFKKVETVYECKPIFNEEYSKIKIIILPFNELYKNTGYDVGYDVAFPENRTV